MGGNFFLSMYIITKNPYAWQGKVDGLITVHAFFLQNVMPAVSDVAKLAVGALVAYNFAARNQKRRVEPTTRTISSKPMYEFPNNGGL